MQTEFWDAPKRDRAPYSADLYVSARTARAAFGHATDPIVKHTLDDLLKRVCFINGLPTRGEDINCIPAFNAWWILDLGDLYRFSGDREYLASQRENLRNILARMETQLKDGLFADDPSKFLFADWSPGMYHFAGQTAPDAVKITTMIYYASENLGWTWLWYVAGIVTGAMIIFTFALFEKKRDDMLRVVEGLKDWQR